MMVAKELDELFEKLESKNNTIRYEAFQKVMEITEKKVTWIYDKWFILVEKLKSDNSFQRSIGIMVLANLAKSDSDKRFFNLIDDYLACINDEKFITSRQCIQGLWKISIADKKLSKKIVEALQKAYYDNLHLATHANLIKQDIIGCLMQIFNKNKEKKLLDMINKMIEEEKDAKMKQSLQKIVKSYCKV